MPRKGPGSLQSLPDFAIRARCGCARIAHFTRFALRSSTRRGQHRSAACLCRDPDTERSRAFNRSNRVSSPIENYALIGNLRTAALVDRTGSIDWLCIPRFDSGACFAALLGTRENGRWLLAPKGEIKQVRRKYRENTLLLETEFETESGVATVVDFMPIAERPDQFDLIRVVKGIRGQVPMRTEVIFRFDYGNTIPWVRK